MEIPHIKCGRKLYFKKSEIDLWLSKGRIKTMTEIEAEAKDYLSKKRIKSRF
jgi:hypothetical protein